MNITPLSRPPTRPPSRPPARQPTVGREVRDPPPVGRETRGLPPVVPGTRGLPPTVNQARGLPPTVHQARGLPRDRMLNHSGDRLRRIPSRGDLLRRRLIVTATKYVLPLVALALLTMIAMWPQIDRAREQARVAFRRMSAVADGATVADARYRSVDERGRPFTVTAANAIQITPERIDLTAPKGDMTLENGTWTFLESKQGIFEQRIKQLDLSQDVTLYRDDGMILHTDTAAIDLRASAAAGADPVHVEGPTGTLDAAGFALTDRGDSIQFGPGHSVLNAADHPAEAPPEVDPDAMPVAAPAPPQLPPPVHDAPRRAARPTAGGGV